MLTWVNATTSLALALLNTLWALYLLRSPRMSPTAFGVLLGTGAPGAGHLATAQPAAGPHSSPSRCSFTLLLREATLPSSHAHIRNLVTAYLARHPAEERPLAPLTMALEAGGDPTSRSTLPGHITCSAIVIDREKRVLHIRHEASGELLAPGGHVQQGDRTLLEAALREVNEQAGIPPGALCATVPYGHEVFDIGVHDLHDIDAGAAKGEPAHRHYDFRFVFCLGEDTAEVVLRPEEVSGARWRRFEEVTSPTVRAKLLASGLDGRVEPVNASALIHDRGRYLLHLRDNFPDIWEPGSFALLGGGREPEDQTLRDTLRRELAEEVPGLELTGVEPFAIERATGVNGLTVPVQVFAGQWSGDPDRLFLREGVLLRWFTPDQLHRIRLSPGLGDLIHRHAAEHPTDVEAGGMPRVWDLGGRTVLNGIGVHLHLEDEAGRVLLGLRHPDVPYAGNTWHYLAGKCERESALACLVREAREEAGLVIDPADLTLAHIVHLIDTPGGQPLMQLVFRARRWKGVPEVLEPDKCLAWKWWDPRDLPKPIVVYTKSAIEGITAGRPYSEMGW
ncbi:NUDIX domain-containing protein [Streptomyces sp. PvR034]|uniref:NUDIX domain-containing protein n=1 Tax=Streptomyces sp. PvR034 TaxID=3156401 RepID=UPI00339A3D65